MKKNSNTENGKTVWDLRKKGAVIVDELLKVDKNWKKVDKVEGRKSGETWDNQTILNMPTIK